MKILHVTPSMDPKMGGVCQAVRTMIVGLDTLGVGNEVVSLDAYDAYFLKQNASTMHALGPAKGPWAYSPSLLPWLVENFSRFDAVIIHGLWLYYGYAVRKAMQYFKRKPRGDKQGKSKIPKLFIMPHGMLDPYFQRAPGRKLKALRNYVYWKLIESWVVNEADGVLFTCEEECRLAREPFRVYRPKYEMVIGLGVEQPPAYTPALRQAFYEKCPALQNAPYILFLSRIHEKKGVDLLIKAYAEFISVGRTERMNPENSNFPRLVIAGPDIETTYGQEMQQLVSNNPTLIDSVFFLGMLTGDAKWGAFYNAEAFILPSHQENFGIAVVEAMACGKPVLISNQVNIWREIKTSGSGLVAEDTCQGTLKLLQGWFDLSMEEKMTMGRQAQVTCEKYFTIDSAANRLLTAIRKSEIYEKVN